MVKRAGHTRTTVKRIVTQDVLPKIRDAVTDGRGGVLTIFWGNSGTGRTLAARAVASNFGLQLMQLNLGHEANKYIGETEKNLESVFNTASETGTVLFFDEAEALFGKRTEVQDSHDRYANIETSYLIRMIERFEGVVILATNDAEDIDAAFVRRASCIVCFEDE